MIRFAVRLCLVLVLLGALGAVAGFYLLWYFGRDLPDYQQLANYSPAIVTRVHASDGRLLAEFATERRVFVPVSAMPRRVIEAFLAAEDSDFYSHPGINPFSIARAAAQNLMRVSADRRPRGASTITQQVAKNFLLTNEVSFQRKIKEAILAVRIERALSKDRILELYLNEIYLGFGSYGVGAAATNYFTKSLDELDIAEAAYLAALPKAPNNYHPIRNHQAALARRNYVLERMREERFITAAELAAATAEPLAVRLRDDADVARGEYFAEEVRRQLAERFGEDALYRGGLSVRTSLDPRLQAIADRTLREGLRAYDRRHGWRGPIARIEPGEGWRARLLAVSPPPGLAPWRLAVVLSTGAERAEIGFSDGTRAHIALEDLVWARKHAGSDSLGPTIHKPADVLAPGEVVAVEALKGAGHALRQIPEVQGAAIALDPHTGRVLAMVGGYSQEMSVFNRASQAKRQPGSAFKPIVYAAGLDSGYTPSTLILDAPIVIEQGPGLPKWKPENYSGKFYGPVPMRVGIEASRNVMTVRLAQSVGMEKIADYAERFGVVDHMPRVLSMALGAGETTLLRLSAAYAIFVNGGRRIVPSLIDRVQDKEGRTLFQQDKRACQGCRAASFDGGDPPELPDPRERALDPVTAYQIVSMLEGVVQRGTGAQIGQLGRTLAGKTGTTNESFDAWFLGFTPNLVFGVFVGFDQPQSLGPRETGASAAVPVFKEFMAEALAGTPDIPFRVPEGVTLVRVNPATGLAARPGERAILEAFRAGHVPTERGPVLEGVGEVAPGEAPVVGTGGIY